MPLPLGQEGRPLPPHMQEIVTKARTSWLKNAEVLDILLNHKSYRLQVGTEAPNCPTGGCLFLFNRRLVRFFRKDGHRWRKKSDGKTVRETHEKLKIDNKDALNCYYAHAEATAALQRRCYWLLEGEGDIVLVHYLSSNPFPRAPSAVLLAAIGSENGSIKASREADFSRSGSAPAHFPVEALQAAVTITTGRSQIGEGASPSQRPCSCHLARPSGAQECQLHDGVGRAASLPTFCNDVGKEPSSSTLPKTLPSSAGNAGFSGVFPRATVQTGFTIPTRQQSSLQDSRHSSQSDVREAGLGPDNTLAGPLHSDVTSSDSRLCTAEIIKTAARPSRAEDGPVSRSAPAEPDSFSELHCDLKPAMSLTRVDSDTLRVAPSLSRATSGASRPSAIAALEAREPTPSCPVLPSSIFSPFYAVAFSGKPIERLDEVADASGVSRAVTAPAAPSDDGLFPQQANTLEFHMTRESQGMRPRKRHCTEGSSSMEIGSFMPADALWDAGLGSQTPDMVEQRIAAGAAAARGLPWLDLHPPEVLPGNALMASEGRPPLPGNSYLPIYMGQKPGSPQNAKLPGCTDLLLPPNTDLDWDLTF